MQIHIARWALLGVLLLGTAGMAQADTLVGVLPTTPGGTNYQAYYDSTTNLTWLANANAAVGSSYDTHVQGSGLMTWYEANAWASGLDINGVTGWTLPTTMQPDSTCSSQYNAGGGLPLQGYNSNCTGSQLGNLFYNALGGTAGKSITTSHNSNYNDFSNVQSGSYWSATGYAPNPNNAWDFDVIIGSQLTYNKNFNLYAWAVHSGDVGAPPSVPEPGALSLMLMGLALAGIAARRRLVPRSFE